ncbi:sel1 repeat family protein [Jannaschia sp.]|nr:sel1 repeat family protein [Jannaschia sp.]MDB2407694.1 sel1 repeat family protein [Jannaschia sp.]
MIRATLLALCLAGGAWAQDSLAELERAAEAGAAPAQRALAERLIAGDGLLPDYGRAADLLRQAAEQGDAAAQNRLGQMLHAGLGVAPDPEGASRWLAAAAESGVPAHLYDYAAVLEASDPTAAATLYERAADAGFVAAETSLGVLLQEGRGVARDAVAARARYESAAKAGDMRAANNLGLLLVRGDGVAQDYERAAALFARAAEAGSRQGMTNLAVMYENGFGVPMDEARAAALYRLGASGAVSAGADPGWIPDPRLAPLSPESEAGLARSAEAGDPVAEFQFALLLAQEDDFPALRRAASLLTAAAEAGYGPAMANLARLYFLGQGVPQDFVLGHMWLLLAQRAGVDTTALTLAFGARATSEQVAEAQDLAQAKAQ